MKKKILVILGHPSLKSFNKAIFNSYTKGAKESGYNVKTLYLAKLKFDPILHEGYNKLPPLEKDLIKSQKLITWADHIVFIFPTWWGSMPALMKGFIDRLLLPGYAFRYTKHSSFPIRLLKGKSARLIITAGGSWWVYMIFRHPGIKLLKRFTLNFCGIMKVRTTLFKKVRRISKTRAKKILNKVYTLGKKGI